MKQMKKTLLLLLLSLVLILSSCNLNTDDIKNILGDLGNNIPGLGDVTTAGGGDQNPAPDSPHKDDDKNGKCDECGIEVIVNIDFFSINDLHGKIVDNDSQPGLDELTTYFKNAYQNEDHVILMSAGDMWQGSVESNMTRGSIIIDWMNEMDFVSMTLGNHEFDWGEEQIAANQKKAEFPFLAINVYEKSTGKLAPYCTPSVVVEKGGVQIGIIGAIGDCLSSISGQHTEDLQFKTGRELTALVKAESERLRAEEGVDFVVYSIHDGHDESNSSTQSVASSAISSYYDTALSNGYVDLVFEGHSHQSYVMRDQYGVYHIQGGGDNYGISHIGIIYNHLNGKSSVDVSKVIRNSVYAQSASDALIGTLVNKYDSVLGTVYDTIGYNKELRDSDQLKRLAAMLYYQLGMNTWNDQYPIVLGGGFTSVRSPYELPRGDVNYAQLNSLFPFDNEIVLCSISGAKLRERFFENTNTNYYWNYGEYGAEVMQNLNLNATYYIVTDTYNLYYKDNGLTLIDTYSKTLFVRDLIAGFVKNGGMGEKQQPVNTTVAGALEIGGSLDYNASTTVEYIVSGTLGDITSTMWGNTTLLDGNGNALTIYGMYDTGGNIRYDAMTVKPQKGDTVTLQGVIKRYVDPNTSTVIIELVDAKLLAHTPGTSNPGEGGGEENPPATTPVTATIPEINAIGEKLGDNEKTAVEYIVSGTLGEITSAMYGNTTLIDEKGNILIIYGMYDSTGTVRYDAMAVKPQKGDTVTLQGYVLKYVGSNGVVKIEIEDAKLIAHIPATSNPGEGGGEENPPATNPVTATIPEILEIGNKLGDNEKTAVEYIVSGKLGAFTDLEYGNTVLIDDLGNQLTIYGIVDANGNKYNTFDVKPVKGDTVTLRGYILKYVNANNGAVTIEIKNAVLVAHTPSGEAPKAPITATIADALAAGEKLADNAQTDAEYIVTGVIKEIAESIKGRIYIQDDNGNVLYIYNVYDKEGTVSFGSLTTIPAVGDTVTLQGYIKKYVANGTVTIEMMNGKINEHKPGTSNPGEGGGEENPPATGPVEATIEKALEVGNALAAGGITPVEYIISGTVKQILSEQYGEMWITDGNGHDLYVYGITGYASMTVKPGVGSSVTLQGYIQKYSNASTGETIVELGRSTLNAYTPSIPAPENVTIEEALQIGNALGNNVSTTVEYIVTGVIKEVSNPTYGAMTIQDEKGNTLYIYGVYDANEVRYDSLAVKPVAGDSITLQGTIKKYVNNSGMVTVQITKGYIVAHTPGTSNPDEGGGEENPPATTPVTATIPEINAIGEKLGDNEKTAVEYIVSGTLGEITSTMYGNTTLIDEKGNILIIYGMYDSTGTVRYDAMAVKPQKGDTVTLQGYVLKYVGSNGVVKIEIEDAKLIAHIPAASNPGEGGGNENPPATNPVTATIPEILEIGNKLGDNQTTTVEYIVSGKLGAFTSLEYGNTVLIDDLGNQLTIYGIVDANGNKYNTFEVKPVKGDTVTLRGYILKYVNANNGAVTVEIKNAVLVAHTPSGEAPKAPITATIADALAAGEKLADNAQTDAEYIVTGVIKEIAESIKGRIYIQDNNGNMLYIYNVYDKEGTVSFGSLTTIPAVGDTVTLQGYIKKYVANGTVTIEMMNGKINEHKPATTDPGEGGGEDNPPATNPVTATIPEINAIGEKLGDNEKTAVEYIVSGTLGEITSTMYGNTTLIDAQGNTLIIYGLYDSTGAVRYDAMAVKPQKGDTVTLQGVIKKYVDSNGKVTIELFNAKVTSHSPL